MNPASPPDTPSEWSKFAPLPPRLRNHAASFDVENMAAASSSTSVSPDASFLPDDGVAKNAPSVSNPTNTPNPSITDGESESVQRGLVFAPLPDQFLCQKRKCQERRERRNLAPRHLFSAHWRPMKIGKRQMLVLDLTICCPDCGYEHHDTRVPPEWEEVYK